MNRDSVESTAHARPGNTQAAVDLELREMAAAQERLTVSGQEHPGLLVQRQRHVRAKIEVSVNRARVTHDYHAKSRHPATEDIFARVPFSQFLQCADQGACVGRSRTKSPILVHSVSGKRLSQHKIVAHAPAITFVHGRHHERGLHTKHRIAFQIAITRDEQMRHEPPMVGR